MKSEDLGSGRLGLQTTAPQSVVDTCARCVVPDFARRPSVAEIVAVLEAARDAAPSPSGNSSVPRGSVLARTLSRLSQLARPAGADSSA